MHTNICVPPKSTHASAKVVEEYFEEGAAAIDVHNHYRQGGLRLEEAWGTTKWEHRVAATIIGMSEVCLPVNQCT